MANILILGAGGFGTALAVLCDKCGHRVTLYSPFQQEIETLSAAREHKKLLPGVIIPESVAMTWQLPAHSDADLVIVATPSFAVRGVCASVKGILSPEAVVSCVAKGFEQESLKSLSVVIAEELPQNSVVMISGPSHAEEVARAMPTGVVAASNRAETAELVQRVFTNERFRVYTHDDMVGVELAGALKNVAALCCGVSDGLGLGDNTKALLITRAMAETSRLAERLGGRKETLAGLAGMGDLIVTCTSMHSRNRRAGIAIGEGRTPQEVVADMGGVVEGYYAAVSAKELADSLGVEMPICEAMYDVLYNGAEVRGMVHRLMSRAPKRETDNGWV